MRPLNKKITLILALLTLLGILTCALVSAIPCKDDVAAQGKAATCHFMCHSSHHQWIPMSNAIANLPNKPPETFVQLSTTLLIEPPIKSFFHPPNLI